MAVTHNKNFIVFLLEEDYKRLRIRLKHLFQAIDASLETNDPMSNPHTFPIECVGWICKK